MGYGKIDFDGEGGLICDCLGGGDEAQKSAYIEAGVAFPVFVVALTSDLNNDMGGGSGGYCVSIVKRHYCRSLPAFVAYMKGRM